MSSILYVPHKVVPAGIEGADAVKLPSKFDADQMEMTCNVCRKRIRTTTTASCNPVCCILFGCFALCCCQDVEHKCPNCNTVLGKYSAMS